MNESQPNTEEVTFEGREPGPWRVAIGTVVLIDGIPMRIVNVNECKRRLTLSLYPEWPMCSVVRDPAKAVRRAKA